MGKIVVVGLGPGDVGQMTFDAVQRLTAGELIILRTERHPVVKFLEKRDIEYSSYDYLYEEKDDFEEIYDIITKKLVEKTKKYDIINYCVPGNPFVAEKVVKRLLILQREGKINLEIVSGISFIESVISTMGFDANNGLKVIDGSSFENQSVDINADNIITQVYNNTIASFIKLKLMDIYDDDQEIYIINVSESDIKEKMIKIELYELDRLDTFDYQTYLYIPKVDKTRKKRYDMNNLIDIMERLRSRGGCPWDIKQTHKSLREYVLEEAYEVVDAIDKDDVNSLAEELGDLLLQVIFHSQIGREEGYFTIWDVITGISNKLVHRHPHVFGEEEASNSEEVKFKWDQIKDKEKNITSHTERLKDVPKGMSALIRSYKIQKRAADIGFDWNDIDGPVDKVKEELEELLNEYYSDNKENIEGEIGDLLFAVVNLSRILGTNPEIAINKTIKKFIERFEYMESESEKQGKNLKSMDLEEMDELWNQAKVQENKEN